MTEGTRRVTAFGVVKKLREVLKLEAGATDQQVLDATLAAIRKGQKGGQREPEPVREPEPAKEW